MHHCIGPCQIGAFSVEAFWKQFLSDCLQTPNDIHFIRLPFLVCNYKSARANWIKLQSRCLLNFITIGVMKLFRSLSIHCQTLQTCTQKCRSLLTLGACSAAVSIQSLHLAPTLNWYLLNDIWRQQRWHINMMHRHEQTKLVLPSSLTCSSVPWNWWKYSKN